MAFYIRRNYEREEGSRKGPPIRITFSGLAALRYLRYVLIFQFKKNYTFAIS
jgi:hypothetical protein